MKDYINLKGLIEKPEIENIFMHTQVWEIYLTHNFKINLNRSLDILKALLLELDYRLSTPFTVDFRNGDIVHLLADYRMSDRSILIDFNREKHD